MWESPADRFRLQKTMIYTDPLIPAPTYQDIAAANTLVVAGPSEIAAKKEKYAWVKAVIALFFAFLMVAAIVFFALKYGVHSSVVAVIAAFFPMVLVVGTLAWMDRWEPEPKWLLLLAFLWGAGVATSLSMVFNDKTVSLLGGFFTVGDDPNSFGATFVAPIVEETMKGIGVVALLLLNRRKINSPLDGVVVASILAAGFAFTENVLYFARGFDNIFSVFLMRAVMSPFAHSLFTSMLGLAMGLALTRSRFRFAWIWMAPIGWLTSVALHGLWNGLASYYLDSFYFIYAVFWLPVFIIWLAMMTITSVKQRQWIITGLQAYVKTGWIHPMEADMLSSLYRRRVARTEAQQFGTQAAKAMENFQLQATEMALTYVTLMYTGHSPLQRKYLLQQVRDVVGYRREYEKFCQIGNAKQMMIK